MLLAEVLVPLRAALCDPLREGHTNQGVDHVADVLTWHLADLLHDGQGLHDRGVRHPKVEDRVERQVLVLRNGDELDVFAVDGLQEN